MRPAVARSHALVLHQNVAGVKVAVDEVVGKNLKKIRRGRD